MKGKWGQGAVLLILSLAVIFGQASVRTDTSVTQGISASGQVIYDTWPGRDLTEAQADISKLETDSESLRADSGKIASDIYQDYRDDSSTNLAANSPEMVALLTGLKAESPGVTGWLVGFANSEKIVFYNHAYMLTYDIVNRRFSSAFDLMAIDAGHIQGSIVTNFVFSPDGHYVIINNGLGEREPGWAAKMYLGDLETGSVREIKSANYFRITDSWSANSRYYAFADRSGTEITIYDTADGTNRSINFGQGEIDRIIVSGNGDIVVETESIFLLSRGKDGIYNVSEWGLQGNILTVTGFDLVYYSGDAIRKYNFVTGADRAVRDMENGLMLSSVDREQAVFTSADRSRSIIYNLSDGNLYEYGYSYESSPQLKSWSFAPDSQYCLIPAGEGYLAISAEGNLETVQVENLSSIDGGWINDHTFASVLISNGWSGMAGDFKIVAYDLEKKQRKILYEQ